MIVSIDGPIAAGKTTLARALASIYQVYLVEEAYEEIPTLNAFYEDPHRYAVQTEYEFVRSHARQLELLRNNQRVTVVDFAFERDLVYAKVTIGRRSAPFKKWHNEWVRLRASVPRPDWVILLNCPVEILLDRIRKRGRPFETKISAEYLRSLEREFENVYRRYPPRRVIEVDSSQPLSAYKCRTDIADIFHTPIVHDDQYLR